MGFKFSVVDDISDLVIGYSDDVLGLLGESYNNGDFSYHKITLLNFHFCDDFKVYIKKQKESLSRLVYICVIDKEMKPLGKFNFAIFDEIYYHKIGFPECPINLVLKGFLEDTVSKEEIELWERWRTSFPVAKNEWSSLTDEGRRAWLQIVKRYNFCIIPKYEEKMDGTYHLDGTCITDYPSFFCALGESMNGPGGYYGFDFNSCMDCMDGGFGPRAPFTLIWKNSKVAAKGLNTDVWLREIEYKNKINSNILKQSDFIEVGNRPLFQAIIENFLDRGIKIILEP